VTGADRRVHAGERRSPAGASMAGARLPELANGAVLGRPRSWWSQTDFSQRADRCSRQETSPEAAYRYCPVLATVSIERPVSEPFVLVTRVRR